MEMIRCNKCGRPLRDPESIARGMGPECANVTGGHWKGYGSSKQVHQGSTGLMSTGEVTIPTLFSLVEKEEQQKEDVNIVADKAITRGMSDILLQFPTDLVDLVLSEPPTSAVAFRTKTYSSRKKKQLGSINPGKALKEIRRICIEIRLVFWPGISDEGRPVACVPYGASNWKFENSERVLSRVELEAYLVRYGMISPVR
jgi:hypothetical protein